MDSQSPSTTPIPPLSNPPPPASPIIDPQPTTHNSQPTTHNSQPTTHNSQPTPIPSPSPDMRLHLNAEPTDNPASNIHPPTSLFHSRLFLPITLITLISLISLISLSVFFLKGQRQPKTSSRAAEPSSQPTTHNSQPTSNSHSGFSALLSKDNPSTSAPISPARNASHSDAGGPTTPTTSPSSPDSASQPTTHNSQPTTQNPQPTSVPRIIYEITANGDTFNPSQITATAGQIVSLYITAVDKIYDVIIPDLGLEKVIYPGDQRFLEFHAIDEGQYTFSCKNCDASAKGIITVKK